MSSIIACEGTWHEINNKEKAITKQAGGRRVFFSSNSRDKSLC